jgi:hypothetical protein
VAAVAAIAKTRISASSKRRTIASRFMRSTSMRLSSFCVSSKRLRYSARRAGSCSRSAF